MKTFRKHFFTVKPIQIDQNSRNLRKLVPQRFVFRKIDTFKVIF